MKPIMAAPLRTLRNTRSSAQAAVRVADPRLAFNVDAVAIALALTLAALVRLNVLPHVGW
jgi:hypothetical protein